MPRWFQDWRTQAVLCVLFSGSTMYFALYLLNGAPSLVWLQLAWFAFLAISAGHTALTERRAKLREHHTDESHD